MLDICLLHYLLTSTSEAMTGEVSSLNKSLFKIFNKKNKLVL